MGDDDARADDRHRLSQVDGVGKHSRCHSWPKAALCGDFNFAAEE